MTKLALWRLERRLSQWELSAATGLPRWLIQLIECGHRSATTNERQTFASALAVEENVLFPEASDSTQRTAG